MQVFLRDLTTIQHENYSSFKFAFNIDEADFTNDAKMQLLMVLSQAEAAADVDGDAADADVADARQVMWSTRQGGQIRSLEKSRQPEQPGPGQPRQPPRAATQTLTQYKNRSPLKQFAQQTN